ncbi:hypothetical protein ABT275_03760 [Streptomyces sp. NPDC001185]|uniref:DUF6907 domain-containing protein n=1 Tax=Streptomyces sp. NPDC001185 TaxID=3154380 RepID=UPI00332C9F8A
MSQLPMATASSPTPTAQRSPHLGQSIVTALVNGVQVPVACPTWFCTMDHAGDDAVGHLDDIDHTGEDADLMVPSFLNGDQLLAHAYLGQDPAASDPRMKDPHVRVTDGGDDFFLTPEMADTFARTVDTFGSKVRAFAHLARSTALGEDGHFPWCNTSACGTYEAGEDGPYVDHQGVSASVRAPRFMTSHEGVLVRAHLHSDAAYGNGGASVSLTGCNGDGTILDPDELGAVIDDLAGFLDQLRVMHHHLKAVQA